MTFEKYDEKGLNLRYDAVYAIEHNFIRDTRTLSNLSVVSNSRYGMQSI